MIAVILLTGCIHPRDSRAVTGEYEADYPIATERLVLADDGTFTQVVTLKSTGKRDSLQGTWRYDVRDGYVTLGHHFLIVLDGFGKFNPNYTQPSAGLVSEPVETFLGRTTIGVSEGILYHKRGRDVR